MSININQFNQYNNYGQTLNIDIEWSSITMQCTTQGTGFVGKLIPIFVRELIPGQSVDLKQQVGIQFMPFVSNVLHEFTGVIKNYFVPIRLLDENWEDFIQGGIDGKNAYQLPFIDLKKAKDNAQNNTLEHTVLDFLGYPINGTYTEIPDADTSLIKPIAYPIWAYNKIYNDHIRPIDVQPDEVDKGNIEVLPCLWQWDYFTRARVYQQRGNVPLVPLQGAQSANLNHVVNYTMWDNLGYETQNTTINPLLGLEGMQRHQDWLTFLQTESLSGVVFSANGAQKQTGSNDEGYLLQGAMVSQITSSDHSLTYSHPVQLQVQDHTINLEGTGINLNDLYQSMGIMSVLINNAKIKYLYIDWLEQRFGIKKQDSRLQMAEYISTQEFNINSQTITQMSYGDVAQGQTPQGYITSQASALGEVNNNYTAQEHGYIMSIMEIKPATAYEGGLPRLLQTKTRFEFATPELVNMPDREIYKGELFYTQTEADRELFGWGGVYDEYRTMHNTTCGLLRPSAVAGLASYTLTRYFTQAPSLNLAFLQCNPDMQRVLQYTDEPDFIFIIQHRLNTAIPLPLQSNPAELLNL